MVAFVRVALLAVNEFVVNTAVEAFCTYRFVADAFVIVALVPNIFEILEVDALVVDA
jgi:hypothetical protein